MVTTAAGRGFLAVMVVAACGEPRPPATPARPPAAANQDAGALAAHGGTPARPIPRSEMTAGERWQDGPCDPARERAAALADDARSASARDPAAAAVDADDEAIATIALRRAFSLRDELPDRHLLGAPALVLDEVSPHGTRLGPQVVARRLAQRVRLVSFRDLLDRVDAAGRPLAYARLRVEVQGDEAMVSVGTELRFPFCSDAMAMCCCTRYGDRYQRVNRRWRFVAQGESTRCS